MLLMLMMQELHIPVPGAVLGAAVTVGLGWLATYSATTRANEKSQVTLNAQLETKFDEMTKSVGLAVAELKQVDRDQWKKIAEVEGEVGDARVRVARLEGRLDGRTRGASAGTSV